MQDKQPNPKLIIGLGNTGREYEYTRHNAGFRLVDRLRTCLNLPEWKLNSRLNAEITKSTQITLAKPTTLMNDSGRAATAISSYFKLANENIIVCYDDLDIQFGKYKLTFNKGPEIHNGINSIKNHIGVGWWHLRIGIDNRTPKQKRHLTGAGYVLQKFTTSEQSELEDILDQAVTELLGHIQTNTNTL